MLLNLFDQIKHIPNATKLMTVAYSASDYLCQNLQIMESNSLLETNNGSTKTIQ